MKTLLIFVAVCLVANLIGSLIVNNCKPLHAGCKKIAVLRPRWLVFCGEVVVVVLLALLLNALLRLFLSGNTASTLSIAIAIGLENPVQQRIIGYRNMNHQ